VHALAEVQDTPARLLVAGPNNAGVGWMIFERVSGFFGTLGDFVGWVAG
jgi:hypothetical protein